MQVNSSSFAQTLSDTQNLSTNKVDESEANFLAYLEGVQPSRSFRINKGQEHIPWENQRNNPYPDPSYPVTFDRGYEESKSYDPFSAQWDAHLVGATNGNKYDNAPMVKEFIKKWMENGESEIVATERAIKYIDAGLLDYGEQKIARLYRGLPPKDIKQHGMWLIDNPPFKNAMLKTLDSLEYEDVNELVKYLFLGEGENDNSNTFQDRLNEFGVELADLRKKDPELYKEEPIFTGNIDLMPILLDNQKYLLDEYNRIHKYENAQGLKEEELDEEGGKNYTFEEYNNKVVKKYNSFISKVVTHFFDNKIDKIKVQQKEQHEPKKDFSTLISSLESIIDNYKTEYDKYLEVTFNRT